jgi:hypothetical protein
MALFTDAVVITLDDLLGYEATLVQVASTHGINVDTKISLATSAISDRLLLWLLSIGIQDPQHFTRRNLGLSTVVVSAAMRRWLTFSSLCGVFAEAYNLQLNTRFQGKLTEYQKLTGEASVTTFQAGIGIVYNPLPQPALPLVSVQSGSSAATGLFVQTTWINTEGQESALSPVNGVILPDDSSITVGMAEGSLGAPAAAIGWNVYVSVDEGAPTMQNVDGTLQIGSTWSLPATGIVSGFPAGDGQNPDYYIQMSKQILRG